MSSRASAQSRTLVRSPMFVYLAVCLIAVLAFSSVLAMLGDINASQAKRLERRWEKSPSTINLVQWQAAENYLQSALMFSPGHPDYLESLGRLYSWRLFVPPESGAKHGEPQEQALSGLAYYWQAVNERPYRSSTWAELALLKSQLGQIDDEFWLAFQNADRLGPYEKPTLLNLLNAGLGAFKQLSWEQRAEVQALFNRMLTLRWTDTQALKIADQLGMQAALCYGIEELQVRARIRRQCQKALQSLGL